MKFLANLSKYTKDPHFTVKVWQMLEFLNPKRDKV